MALCMRLEAMGYTVESASDAVYAMSSAMTFKPEVVLLDINLPGGDGFVVADRLRASAELANTPIIFITASQDPKLRALASEYRASRYMEKPFQALELVETIDQLCG